MFKSNLRNVNKTRSVLSTTSSTKISTSASIKNNQSLTNRCKLTHKSLAFVFLSILGLFSFHLATKILAIDENINPNQHEIPMKMHNNQIPKPLPDDLVNKYINMAKPSFSGDIKTTIQKSFAYINRPGHDERVRYLIGFRQENVFTDSSQYASLKPRTLKTNDRDYTNDPIKICGWTDQPPSETKCDALCVNARSHCDVDGIQWSMENIQVRERNNVITGTTKLNSLVPVPYFSWHDFQFMTEVKPKKTASALAAAFISNCGFPKRNKMVRDLQKYGVSVHSFGRCEHNKDEVRRVDGKGGSKIDILSDYKFSLAFENSETDDYVTEKFFGTFQSGSVPVYIGASNIKFFAPDVGAYGMDVGKPWQSKSVIWAGDYDFDAERLANYLLYLDGNDTAYNDYLRYKVDGYSGDFKAMVELTAATHTNCRQCILGTDWMRYKHGISVYDEPIMKMKGREDVGKWIYVRERGMYRFSLLWIQKNTMGDLIGAILNEITPKPVNTWKNNAHPDYDRIGPAVYAMYHVPTKQVIHTDEVLGNLQNYVEIEVIFV